MAEDHLAASVPMQEHRGLAAFAGKWNGEEMVGDDTYTMTIQFSPDAEGWADVLIGVYRHIH